MTHTNIVLIGMPGAGKSTVGVLLAKETAKGFVDTDVVIQEREGRTLQEIMDTEGYLELRAVEERVICSLDLHNHVISTGGSAAYSERAMAHLKTSGIVVFLYVAPDVLLERLTNFDQRGIARRPGQTWQELYDERFALYRRYADITIDCGTRGHDEVCALVCAALDGFCPQQAG
ncbi:MAG: homoserine kinase [Armatimonadaceae bacterium]